MGGVSPNDFSITWEGSRGGGSGKISTVLHRGDPANDDGVPYIHIYGVLIQEISSHQI